ncbi:MULTISPECIES: endonuclease domain-containing protein [Psychrilyobacter]|uniref:DUF559 domain-containing protein n=1 Tax=Psychrilyobacter piezotolerans TaxID=2293438 RepID=A0ABX9KDP6_9FUSO|nr:MULTISPECIES: endonuclease domain-containing protein [Psychrilyobacter]MCS5423036.1 endonuclease domain-containing protein [Psychrilyobacter sp. S5]NDI79030.1 endonuclease domain-containing protein [Psychrilyobacter piezotolerans]RDE59117.1 endonuclease domain-containing protein [Psychrilyobacter sp. S5]REI39688.1 DUF559 domain-containing protein [Psychrilyobacter piezotolerans]
MPKIFNKLYNKETRRMLRKHMTQHERLLWERIKNKKILGYRFHRQYGIERYIVDFYCPKLKLIVELDGRQHHMREGVEYDEVRNDFLISLGLTVVRFDNKEIEENIENVIDRIKESIEEL